jgi:hypothetical protein
MKISEITKLQKQNGYFEYQKLINTGDVWKLQGSEGRYAMGLLDCGVCYLPTKSTFDYYGNRIPSRKDLQNGSKGTMLNSQNYWSNENNWQDGNN